MVIKPANEDMECFLYVYERDLCIFFFVSFTNERRKQIIVRW